MGIKELLVVDTETGEYSSARPRKKKRMEGFYMATQTESILIAKMKLSGMELSVLMYLLGIMDYENTAVVSQAFLATELSATQATISNAIKRLCEKGLVSSTTVAGNKAYVLSALVASRGKQK